MARATKSAGSAATPVRRTGADKSAFGERLKTILQHWPSADRLAREMGVSPSAFRKWLKGEAEPSRERLVALAHAARVSVAWLAEGEGPTPSFEQVGDGGRRSNGHQTRTDTDWHKFVLLPQRPEAAAAGSITPPDPSGSEWMALRHDWVARIAGLNRATWRLRSLLAIQ